MAGLDRYVGIDYSGAETPNASLKGLRVFMAEGDAEASEVLPPPSASTGPAAALPVAASWLQRAGRQERSLPHFPHV